jgi:pimeloyl-ACP methyl ester carboxylesterase
MGGKIAQLLASWHPAGLEGLILVAPSPPVPMAVPEEQRKRMNVIPRSGHLSLLEVPDEIATGIRNFLASSLV